MLRHMEDSGANEKHHNITDTDNNQRKEDY